jgi:hypothetical protein
MTSQEGSLRVVLSLVNPSTNVQRGMDLGWREFLCFCTSKTRKATKDFSLIVLFRLQLSMAVRRLRLRLVDARCLLHSLER